MPGSTLFDVCRQLYDKLRQDMGSMSTDKNLAIVHASLGSELIMSLMINEERGDLLMLQIAGKSVRVFADPTKWGGQEIENGTRAEVLRFLQTIERRRRNRRRGGH